MRPLLLITLLTAPLATITPKAQAHAILMQSEPPARAELPPGPTHITLRYNSRIDQDRSRLELRTPTAPPRTISLQHSTRPDTLAADIPLTPGEWVLRWQVLAVDGHITRGDLPLTVKAP